MSAAKRARLGDGGDGAVDKCTAALSVVCAHGDCARDVLWAVGGLSARLEAVAVNAYTMRLERDVRVRVQRQRLAALWHYVIGYELAHASRLHAMLAPIAPFGDDEHHVYLLCNVARVAAASNAVDVLRWIDTRLDAFSIKGAYVAAAEVACMRGHRDTVAYLCSVYASAERGEHAPLHCPEPWHVYDAVEGVALAYGARALDRLLAHVRTEMHGASARASRARLRTVLLLRAARFAVSSVDVAIVRRLLDTLHVCAADMLYAPALVALASHASVDVVRAVYTRTGLYACPSPPTLSASSGHAVTNCAGTGGGGGGGGGGGVRTTNAAVFDAQLCVADHLLAESVHHGKNAPLVAWLCGTMPFERALVTTLWHTAVKRGHRNVAALLRVHLAGGDGDGGGGAVAVMPRADLLEQCVEACLHGDVAVVRAAVREVGGELDERGALLRAPFADLQHRMFEYACISGAVALVQALEVAYATSFAAMYALELSEVNADAIRNTHRHRGGGGGDGGGGGGDDDDAPHDGQAPGLASLGTYAAVTIGTTAQQPPQWHFAAPTNMVDAAIISATAAHNAATVYVSNALRCIVVSDRLELLRHVHDTCALSARVLKALILTALEYGHMRMGRALCHMLHDGGDVLSVDDKHAAVHTLLGRHYHCDVSALQDAYDMLAPWPSAGAAAAGAPSADVLYELLLRACRADHVDVLHWVTERFGSVAAIGDIDRRCYLLNEACRADDEAMIAALHAAWGGALPLCGVQRASVLVGAVEMGNASVLRALHALYAFGTDDMVLYNPGAPRHLAVLYHNSVARAACARGNVEVLDFVRDELGAPMRALVHYTRVMARELSIEALAWLEARVRAATAARGGGGGGGGGGSETRPPSDPVTATIAELAGVAALSQSRYDAKAALPLDVAFAQELHVALRALRRNRAVRARGVECWLQRCVERWPSPLGA